MAKKLPKKPRKPKTSASYATWERFNQRVSNWKKKCSDIINAKKKKETLIKKFSSF